MQRQILILYIQKTCLRYDHLPKGAENTRNNPPTIDTLNLVGCRKCGCAEHKKSKETFFSNHVSYFVTLPASGFIIRELRDVVFTVHRRQTQNNEPIVPCVVQRPAQRPSAPHIAT